MNSLSKTKMIFSKVLVPLVAFGLLVLLVPIGVFAQPLLNQTPVANDDSAITPKNTPLIINIVSNDSDPEGFLDLSSVTITTPPTHGEAENHGDGTIIYTPDTDFIRPDNFVYQSCDNGNPSLNSGPKRLSQLSGRSAMGTRSCCA